MKKYKIIKLVLIGHSLISVPIIALYGLLYFNLESANLFHIIGVLLSTWIYWSFAIPRWRLWSIKRIKSKEQYSRLRKLAINTGLLWPKEYSLTNTEFWDEQNYSDYMSIYTKICNNSKSG